jgi:hypothetical protein
MGKILELFRALVRIGLLGMFGRSSPEPSAQDYRRHIWKDSAGRMGLRMTERLRDAWRSRWLKTKNHN